VFSVQYKMEEKSVWRQKNGRASNNVWAQQIGGRLPALSNRLRHQWGGM